MARPRKPPDQLADRRPSRVAGRIIELAAPSERQRVPRLPIGLHPAAWRAWRDYWRSPVAQAVDRLADMGALRRWAEPLSEWHTVAPAVQEDRTVAGSQGQPVLSPSAGYLRHLSDEIRFYEGQFGMTPLSRSRLGLTIGHAKLTAQELNRRLEHKPAQVESAVWASEWEEA